MTRIVRVPFLIPTWAAAQVLLPNTILVKRGVLVTPRLIAHELKHVDQLRELGLVRYWWAYLRLLRRYGYEAHPMEVAARAVEREASWQSRAVYVIRQNHLPLATR